MAWNINDVKTFIQYLINKNQAGGITVAQFQQAFNAEQAAYMDDLVGRFQNRNTSKEGQNTGLIQNETIMQKLSPFTTPTNLSVSDGEAVKPYGLIYTLALRANGYEVVPITHGQIASVNKSVIDAPSIDDNTYYYTEFLNYFYVLPSTIPTVALDYIRAPEDVVWGYTLNAYLRQVYDPSTSVQPLWDANSIVEITKRTLKTLGVHFKDSDFAQFGSATIATGD